jgi:hypothetical protein
MNEKGSIDYTGGTRTLVKCQNLVRKVGFVFYLSILYNVLPKSIDRKIQVNTKT